MLKKILSTTALTVVLLSTVDAQAKSREVPRDGFYVGLMTGLSRLTANGWFATPSAAGATTDRGIPANISDNGLKTKFLAGYEENFFNDVLIGGHVNYSYNTINTSTPVSTLTGNPSSSVYVKQTESYGATIKVGAPCHDSMAIYATLGAVNSTFVVRHQPALSPAGYRGASVKKKEWGIVPGVEFKLGLTHSLSFHAALQYSIYRTIKADVTGSLATAGTGSSIYKFSPTIADLEFGFTYKI